MILCACGGHVIHHHRNKDQLTPSLSLPPPLPPMINYYDCINYYFMLWLMAEETAEQQLNSVLTA